MISTMSIDSATGGVARTTSPKKVCLVYMNNEENVGRGAGYVASTIRAAGHDLTFIDTMYDSPEQIADQVCDGGFDILMISTMTLIFPKAIQLIRLVKERIPIQVLVGGVHPTLVKDTMVRENPEIDFGCIGEGETMVLDFLEKFGDGRYDEIPNLVYRKDGEVISNPVAPATDLNWIPPFPWDVFKDDAIVQEGPGFAYVTASRGCPYICTYCCNAEYLKMYKKSYLRTLPIDYVIGELKLLKERYNPWLFYFADEMLLFDLDYVHALMTRFKEEIGGRFGLQGRVEFLKDDTVEYLAKCGCRYVAMGAECGDEEFCKKVLKRKISNQMLEDAVKRCQRNGIFVSLFNMIGYPVENDDFLTLQTIRLNSRIKPDYVQVSVFFPFPGTVLAAKAKDEDLIDLDLVESVEDYFSESVLKGKGYITALRNELQGLFNPRPFPNVRELEQLHNARHGVTADWVRFAGGVTGDFLRRRVPRVVTLAKRLPGAKRLARKVGVA